jgi:hypothetical protein
LYRFRNTGPSMNSFEIGYFLFEPIYQLTFISTL